MKVRNGFVSNSSSSSFVLIVKDKDISESELSKLTMEKYAEAYGDNFEDEPEYKDRMQEKANKLAKDGKRVVLIARVEWGGEESVEKVAKEIVKSLTDIDENDIEIVWEE